MHVTFHREGLLAACQVAQSVVPARDVKPVLRHLKLIAHDDQATLLATDTEVGLRLSLRSLHTLKPGQTLLPSDRLLAILRELDCEQLSLLADDQSVTLEAPNCRFEMTTCDAADFPDFPDFDNQPAHQVFADALRELIRRTLFATSSAAAHYGATTGVLWEFKTDLLRLVATDSHRLAIAEAPAQTTGALSSNPPFPVVPVKALSLLERLLQEPEELVSVLFRPNELLLKTERALIYSRLVEGRFPEYERVIPQKCPYKSNLVVGPFLAAVRQAAIMADEENRRVLFTFTPGKLRLEARGLGAGRAQVELAVPYEGKKFDIAFNPKLLIDMLRVLAEDTELVLQMSSSEKPALFHTSDGRYRYVVMPMQLGETGV